MKKYPDLCDNYNGIIKCIPGCFRGKVSKTVQRMEVGYTWFLCDLCARRMEERLRDEGIPYKVDDLKEEVIYE